MYRLSTRLALVLAFGVGLALPAAGQAAPEPGSCTPGTARRDIDANDVRASLFNTGSLFFGSSTDAAQYIVPIASGKSPHYATGIWIGGIVDGDIRTAGATYDSFEFWPGPLDAATARPVNPTDCTAYDRIWKVSRTDIATYESTGQAATDLAEWPADLGAPVLAAPGNGVDDDADGTVDEGTDDVDNDGDGNTDERDEQERRVDGDYDLAGGDRPDIIGDQGIWWVMNDVGNSHDFTSSAPLGVEVQVLVWAFARADALGQTTFYRYRVINKSGSDIEDTYLTIFADTDLGYANDDYIAIDTTLSLAYVYNADNADDGDATGYGPAPPAAGYDFFQGPIQDGDTLGTTVFITFNNPSSGGVYPQVDPSNAAELYNFQRGRWADGTPMTTGGTGYQQTGPETVFIYPGDPVTGQYWSEVNNNQSGGDNIPNDRRLVLSTGPFTLSNGETQDIVFGIPFGQGSDNISSITALKAADQTAQAAYDADFELASPPPPPPPCNADSPNPELRPGSGRCAEVIETDGQVTLVWGYPANQNILGFRERDRLITLAGIDPFYDFEGFNVYQYPDARFRVEDRQLVATFDRETDPGRVIDIRPDPATGSQVPFIAAQGTNSGVQFTYNVEGLTNYTDVYYGITAYSYNEASIPKIIESSPTNLIGRPSRVDAAGGGSVAQADFGTLIRGTFVSGVSAAPLDVRVVDPTSVIPATYRIEFFDIATGDSTTTTYRILRNGTVVYDGAQVAAETDGIFVPGGVVGPFDNVPSNRIIIDGLEFFSTSLDGIFVPTADEDGVADISGDGRGVLEVAYPGVALTCPDPTVPAGTTDYGCANYGNIGNSVTRSTADAVIEGNVNEDYFLTTVSGLLTGTNGISPVSNAAAGAVLAAGNQFEIRFTAEGSLAAQIGPEPTRPIYRIPFEVWNIGQRADFAGDDVRMIPRVFGAAPGAADLTNTFVAPITIAGTAYQRTPVFFAYMPDRRDNGDGPDDAGYRAFEAAALAFGGPGATYTVAADGDTQVDQSEQTGTDCARQGYFTDFCYRDDLNGGLVNAGRGNFPIGNVVFADLAGDGTTPPVGTTVRILTTPAATSAQPGDIYEFSTADFAFVTASDTTAENALDLIGITPNPYLGASSYETGNLERIARFTNVPERATIRVYTVSGSLVRTITKDGPSRSVDWDLTTESGLPIASGMYFIHVDVPGVGDRVLKFGVVNRATQIDVF